MLDRGQGLDLMDHPQAVGRIDQQVGGVLDDAGGTDQRTQHIDEIGRRVHGGRRRIGLPADHPDPAAAADPLLRQDLDHRS